MDDGTFKPQIAADTSEANALGVTGTPAFFVNGKFLSGAKPFEEFATAINAELKRLNLLYDSQQLTDAPAVEMPTTAAPTAAPPAPAASAPKSGLPRWIPAAVFALFALVGGWWWWRQREPIPPPPPVLKEVAEAKPAEDHSLTNASIIEMVSAKVPPNVIVSHVRTAPATRFDASTQGLIDLAKAGVPEPVIREMSSRWKQAPAPPVAPTAGSPAPPGAAPAIVAPKSATPGAASVELTDGRPLEIHFFRNR